MDARRDPQALAAARRRRARALAAGGGSPGRGWPSPPCARWRRAPPPGGRRGLRARRQRLRHRAPAGHRSRPRSREVPRSDRKKYAGAGRSVLPADDTEARAQLALARASSPRARAGRRDTGAAAASGGDTRAAGALQRQLVRAVDGARALNATPCARSSPPTGGRFAWPRVRDRRQVSSKHVIRAPFSGIVIAKAASPAR